MNRIALLGSVLTCALTGVDSLVAQKTIWGGVVTGTWKLADSPVQIKGDITVLDLTIVPGVLVRVDPGKKITVSTWMDASGEAKKPIVFTSNGTGLWGGIHETNLASNSKKSAYRHCTIEKAAGGLTITNSLPALQHCTIQDCSRLTGSGGGIYVSNNTGTLTLEGCTIRRCLSLSYGGGIYAVTTGTGKVSLEDCAIEANQINPNSAQVTRAHGGGAYLKGSINLMLCRIAGNRCNSYRYTPANNISSYSYGGGLSLSGTATVSHTIIVENILVATARSYSYYTQAGWNYGAGAYFDGGSSGSVKWNACIVARNHAYSYTYGKLGSKDHCGGVYIYSGACSFVNCTIVRNTTNRPVSSSVGVFSALKTTTIRNSIIYSNTGPELSSTSPVMTYSCIEGGYPGKGNITVMPSFKPGDELVLGGKLIDGGDPSVADYDLRLITTRPAGPGDGKKQNDMGAHGGPTNDKWVKPANLKFAVSPAVATMGKPTTFTITVSDGNPRFLSVLFLHVPGGQIALLWFDRFGSERSWKLTISNFTPTKKETLRFQVASLTPQDVLILSNDVVVTIK